MDTAWTTTSVTKNYDGLGRVVSTVTASPQCASGLQTNTVYDTMSRVYSVSNPYCSTSDPTYGLTYFAYDGLGRKIKTTLPDGSISTIAYAGNAMETTDPFNGTTNVQHIQQSDGLGRLTSVCEVSASSLSSISTDTPKACGVLEIAGTGYPTTYTYDTLGNMLAVNQHGLARTFTYDNLSRLLTALNPEAGTDTYTYSNSSVACSPSADVPCKRQDARGIVTSYAYDNMSRLTSKSYGPNLPDLTSCYLYNLPILPDSNPKGELTAEWQQAFPPWQTCAWAIPSSAVGVRLRGSHDAMGRVGQDLQCLTGPSASCLTSTTGKFVYTYNLLGNPVQSNNGIAPALTVGAMQAASSAGNGTPMTAPSITWKTTYDELDHIQQVGLQDQPSSSGTSIVWPSGTYSFGPTLLKPTNYDPFGHMTAAPLGIPYGSSTAAVSINRQYDNRGRIVSEVDGGDVIASASAGSVGVISLSGVEAGPITATATSGTGVLSVTGSDSEQLVCTTVTNAYTTYQICNYVPVTGTLSVTIGGFTSTANYGGVTGDATIASLIAAGFTASGSPLTATASGSSVTVTAKATGSATNYPITLSNGGGFTISDPTATLSGGHNAGPAYDAGTATATITNNAVSPAVSYTTAPVSWGQGDTTATLATHLASAINAAAGSLVTASADSGGVNLTSGTAGTSTNYTVAVALSDTQTLNYPTVFPNASFTAYAEDMIGGAAAASSYGTIYSYRVPQDGYAPNGNILAHSDSVMGDWVFSYDAVDRLTAATPGGNVPSKYSNQYGCWTYDSYGNRTLEAFSPATCANNPTPQAKAVYNPANNQIQSISGTTSATFSYDASGNTTNDGRNYYWYDAEGQLCAVQNIPSSANPNPTITQYIYDAEGARIGKAFVGQAPASGATCTPPPASALAAPGATVSGVTLTARYLVDQGGDQVTEFNNNSGAYAWAHSNVWAGGKLTATYDTKGIHYELADPLGTKRVQANAAGQVDEQCTSLPFGNDINNPVAANCTAIANSLGTNDDATEHHFTQKERDTESGNDYFFARYYTSALGRFTTPDWSAKTDPVPYAVFTDPQSLNLYAYVRNNPIIHVDSDGHTCNPSDWGCNPWTGSGSHEREMAQEQAQEQQKQAQQKNSSKGTGFWRGLGQHFNNLAHLRGWNNNGLPNGTVTTTETYTLPAMAGIGAPRGSPQFNAQQGAVNPPGPETPSPTLKPAELPVEEVEESPLEQAVKILGGVLSGITDTFSDFMIMVKPSNQPRWHDQVCGSNNPDCSS